MFGLILLLLLAVPVAELFVIIKVGSEIGALNTLAGAADSAGHSAASAASAFDKMIANMRSASASSELVANAWNDIANGAERSARLQTLAGDQAVKALEEASAKANEVVGDEQRAAVRSEAIEKARADQAVEGSKKIIATREQEGRAHERAADQAELWAALTNPAS